MEPIKIYKFGGVALKNASSIRQVTSIILKDKPQIIVVSAIGKTTDALRLLAEGYLAGDKNMITSNLKKIREIHDPIVGELFPTKNNVADDVFYAVEHCMQHIERMSKDKLVSNDALMYMDVFSSLGEKIATLFVGEFLKQNGFYNEVIMADDLIKTDMMFSNANVLEEETFRAIKESKITDNLLVSCPIVTQGYIASTSVQNETFCFRGPTTLGREGSDYTAGILAKMLTRLDYKVEKVVLWKDVGGVSSDPSKMLNFYTELSYDDFDEAIQKNGFASGLVHSKTVRELKEINVPLWIKDFKYPERYGTYIGK